MIAVSAANYQYLQELEAKLERLKSHVVGSGAVRRHLDAKLRELEEERRILERRTIR